MNNSHISSTQEIKGTLIAGGCVVQTIQNYWLSLWSNAVVTWQQRPDDQKLKHPFPVISYMTTYFGIGLVSIVVQFIASFMLVVATLNASQVCANL
jgi:hypothetical protein